MLGCCVAESQTTMENGTYVPVGIDKQWKDLAGIKRVQVIWIILLVILISIIAALTIVLLGSQKKPCTDPRSPHNLPFRPPCEEDWIFYLGKCFFFSDTDGSWDHGRSFCASHNASLTTIATQKELDFMIRYKGVDDHWIGLRREDEQPWKWPNGTEFNNWFNIKGDSNCAYLKHQGVRNARCYAARKWICTTSEDYLERWQHVSQGGASLDRTKDI